VTAHASGQGFKAFKLKVGSADPERDLRRAAMLRKSIGRLGHLMFDANQHWNLRLQFAGAGELAQFRPLWIESPRTPMTFMAHVVLAREIAPVKNRGW